MENDRAMNAMSISDISPPSKGSPPVSGAVEEMNVKENQMPTKPRLTHTASKALNSLIRPVASRKKTFDIGLTSVSINLYKHFPLLCLITEHTARCRRGCAIRRSISVCLRRVHSVWVLPVLRAAQSRLFTCSSQFQMSLRASHTLISTWSRFSSLGCRHLLKMIPSVPFHRVDYGSGRVPTSALEPLGL